MRTPFTATSHEIYGWIVSVFCFCFCFCAYVIVWRSYRRTLIDFLLKSSSLRQECFASVVLVKYSICLLNRWLPLSCRSSITSQNKSSMKLARKWHARKYANYAWRNMCLFSNRPEILSAFCFKWKESNPIGTIEWNFRFSMWGGLFLSESVYSKHAKKDIIYEWILHRWILDQYFRVFRGIVTKKK